jgi:hypothetical protein
VISLFIWSLRPATSGQGLQRENADAPITPPASNPMTLCLRRRISSAVTRRADADFAPTKTMDDIQGYCFERSCSIQEL